jgi:2'-5' RNA ligase
MPDHGAVTTGLRLFAAVVPPDDALAHLDAFLEVRRDAADFRWTPPEHLHVTLAFLDAVPERLLDDLVDHLGQAAARRTTFETRLSGGGAFPSVADARILWTGLELDAAGRTELDRLATGARTAASRAGTRVDGRRFRPHVTVARLRAPRDVVTWVRLLDGYAGPAWPVDRVDLVASFLGQGPRGRPCYETIDTLALSPR